MPISRSALPVRDVDEGGGNDGVLWYAGDRLPPWMAAVERSWMTHSVSPACCSTQSHVLVTVDRVHIQRPAHSPGFRVFLHQVDQQRQGLMQRFAGSRLNQ